jgi:hypothetical protein
MGLPVTRLAESQHHLIPDPPALQLLLLAPRLNRRSFKPEIYLPCCGIQVALEGDRHK